MAVTFEYPYTSPTTSLTLQSPDQGDANMIKHRPIIHKTMSGNLYTYKRTPHTHQLFWTFMLIKESLLNDLLTFFKTSSGSVIKVTDWNNTVWRVEVLNNPLDVVSVQSNRYTLSLQLEGSLA